MFASSIVYLYFQHVPEQFNMLDTSLQIYIKDAVSGSLTFLRNWKNSWFYI